MYSLFLHNIFLWFSHSCQYKQELFKENFIQYWFCREQWGNFQRSFQMKYFTQKTEFGVGLDDFFEKFFLIFWLISRKTLVDSS